jgi:hypothetical protein
MKIIVMLNVIMDINIKRIHAIVERDNLPSSPTSGFIIR